MLFLSWVAAVYIVWLVISAGMAGWGLALIRRDPIPCGLKARWAILAFGDYALQPVHYLIAAPLLSVFTRPTPDLDENLPSWGGWFGTRDNPPQGDERWLRESPFPHITTGIKGYVNRVGWLWRNPLYGYPANIPWVDGIQVKVIGTEGISDKNRIPGRYCAIAYSGVDPIAFGVYMIKPMLGGEKCFRARIGWKISTDKFKRYGSARLVNTIQPFKRYGM